MEEEARIMYKINITARKMLKKRGYIVPGEDLSWQEFKTKVENGWTRKDLDFIGEKRDPSSTSEDGEAKTDRIYVFFAMEKKLGTKDIHTYHSRLEKAKIFHGILVIDNDVSGFARSAMLAVAPTYRFETFKTNELLVDITEHELVPEHVVLNDDEKKQVLKRYNLKESQLPRMMIDDPISRYFGLGRGQVVKIIRASETAGRYVTYRIVL